MSKAEQTYETLLLEEVEDRVLLLTLNRRKASNALDRRTALELTAVFARLASEPGRHRCIVLTGAGERAFCAGADLKERETLTGRDAGITWPSPAPSGPCWTAPCL